jgi:hypothetical protein
MPIDFFQKTPLKENIPEEMQSVILELKKCPSREECLKATFRILTQKYRGYRMRTYLMINEIFTSDLHELWHRRGFLHCTNINYLMRTLLVGSGHFRDDELVLRWTQIWYLSPHQYIEVKMNDRMINIDVWAYAYGIKFGDYAHGFHCFYPPDR